MNKIKVYLLIVALVISVIVTCGCTTIDNAQAASESTSRYNSGSGWVCLSSDMVDIYKHSETDVNTFWNRNTHTILYITRYNSEGASAVNFYDMSIHDREWFNNKYNLGMSESEIRGIGVYR